MKTFNHQDKKTRPGSRLPGLVLQVGRTWVMAMTDIYRPTHPLITIQLYQGISAVNLVWEEPL